jgi:hypothetical protein
MLLLIVGIKFNAFYLLLGVVGVNFIKPFD